MANVFKSNVFSSIGVTSSSVYTCPSATQTTVIGLSIANRTGAEVTANVIVTSGATSAFLACLAPVSPGQTFIPVGGDQKLVLEDSDFISVQSSAASSLDAIISVLEIS